MLQGTSIETASLLLLAEELSRCLGSSGTALACKLSQAYCEWDYQPSDRSSAKSAHLYRYVSTILICPVAALYMRTTVQVMILLLALNLKGYSCCFQILPASKHGVRHNPTLASNFSEVFLHVSAKTNLQELSYVWLDMQC